MIPSHCHSRSGQRPWGSSSLALVLFLALILPSEGADAGVLLHSGTNIVNEVYDVRKGIDTITSPRASHAIVKGRMRERTAIAVAGTGFLIAILLGLYLIAVRGPVIVAFGLAGLLGVRLTGVAVGTRVDISMTGCAWVVTIGSGSSGSRLVFSTFPLLTTVS